MHKIWRLAALVACATASCAATIAPVDAAAVGELKAGAARVDITPQGAELIEPYKTIHDRLYARTLVLDNGAARAVIVVLDAPAMQDIVATELTNRIAKQAKVQPANVLLSVTHTHNSIRLDMKAGVGTFLPASDQYTSRVMSTAVDSVRQAIAALQPARAGYAKGDARLNASRAAWSAQYGRYVAGTDRSGVEPVDRTLGVLKLEGASGQPIALLLNYGIEPVMNYSYKSEISADVVGATSRYVEQHFDDKTVALFTIGAIANPMYRVRAEDPATLDADRAHKLTDATATILGEETLAIAAGIRKSSGKMPIAGAMKTLQCPGKVTTPLNLPNVCAYTPESKLPACEFKDKDADPVKLNMAALLLGDVVLVQADANVMPAVLEKLKQASPLSNTLVAALNYGPMKYVVDDASYPLDTYEVTATAAKQGCAEQGFIDAAVQMIEQLR